MILSLLVSMWPLSSGAQSCDALRSIDWILGDWVAQGERTVTHESWTRVSPSTFEGAGYVVETTTGAVQNAESLRLVEMSGEVFYLAKVEHNDFPVAFKLVTCAGDAAVFENMTHDFPRRLEYNREGNDSLHVRVSDGGPNGFSLGFGRAAEY